MTHKFTRSATDMACSALTLVISRIEESQKACQGRQPSAVLLHLPTFQALQAESLKRFGVREDGKIMGIPIVLCMCAKEIASDMIIDADGRAEIL